MQTSSGIHKNNRRPMAQRWGPSAPSAAPLSAPAPPDPWLKFSIFVYTFLYIARAAKKDKKGNSPFQADSEKAGMSKEKKDGQKKMDATVVKGLGADVKSYLKARFSLSAKMYPHELKF